MEERPFTGAGAFHSTFPAFPPPPDHVCSGFQLIVPTGQGVECGSPALSSCFRDRASWPDAHRNLHRRLSLAGDPWRERLWGRSDRGAETEDDPLDFCTKIQMRHLGFITQNPLWCMESPSVNSVGWKAMQEA